MQIFLLRHYPLVEGPSMRTYAEALASGLAARGHKVRALTAPVLFGGLFPLRHPLAKWLGYLDQFLIFPPLLWLQAWRLPAGSLCVLADQALGPWYPWLAGRPHLVHCHDLLALEAALGQQPFHQLGRSGRAYQRWICSGFRKARCFLSVSAATQAALEPHLATPPLFSAVLFNPLSTRFVPLPPSLAEAAVSTALPQLGSQSFLFHIGRNWYKNRLGVLEIWEQLRSLGVPMELVLVGAPSQAMRAWMQARPQLSCHLHVLEGPSDALVNALYNRAAALLFPSHAEGFGWPILEALACGCPVITTGVAPMTEVGGAAATYIPPAPPPPASLDHWAAEAALVLQQVLQRTPTEQSQARQLGLAQAARFNSEAWLQQLEAHYQYALALQEAC